MANVDFYRQLNGKAPMEEFLDGLDRLMLAKALQEIETLEKFGNRIREPHSKALGGGLFELRIRSEGNISRVFYFFLDGDNIILTNGFIKKSRRTPTKELALARKYKADYERRNKKL